MTIEAEGWAVIDGQGVLNVRTVSPTRRAAIVNWLLTDKGLMAFDVATDEQIERQWQFDSKDCGARLTRVSIQEQQ